MKANPSTDQTTTLAILIAVTAVGPLALNIFIPSMPGMQAVFQTDYAVVQLTLTFYLAGTAVAQLFLGALSDRFGRRPVLLTGLVLFSLGGLLALFAQTIAELIAARIVQAVGGSAGFVVGRAIVRDLYDQETAASMIAYVTMAMVVAPMIAPALGGFLDVWFDWRAGFVLVTTVGFMVLAVTFTLLPETHRNREGQRGLGLGLMLRGFWALLRSPMFCGYALTMSFTSAIFFSFLAGAPYVMVEILDRSPGEYGLYFILVSIGYMSGNFLAGRLSRRVGSSRMIWLGCLLAIAGTSLLVGLTLSGVLIPLALFGPMMIIAVANGMTLPNATAAAISVNPSITGAASGLSGFLQVAIGALATWVVGALQDETQWPLVLIMAGCSVMTLLMFNLALRCSR